MQKDKDEYDIGKKTIIQEDSNHLLNISDKIKGKLDEKK